VRRGLDQRERVEQAREALQREVLSLHWDDDAIGRNERIDGQRTERGGAVEQGEGVALADRLERVPQTGLRSGDARQFDGGARQIGAGGSDPQVLDRADNDHVVERRRTAEDVIDRLRAILGDAEA